MTRDEHEALLHAVTRKADEVTRLQSVFDDMVNEEAASMPKPDHPRNLTFTECLGLTRRPAFDAVRARYPQLDEIHTRLEEQLCKAMLRYVSEVSSPSAHTPPASSTAPPLPQSLSGTEQRGSTAAPPARLSYCCPEPQQSAQEATSKDPRQTGTPSHAPLTVEVYVQGAHHFDAGSAEALRENGPGPRTSSHASSPGADETANGRPCDSTGLHRTPDVENDRATSSSPSLTQQATHQTEESRSSFVPFQHCLGSCESCRTVRHLVVPFECERYIARCAVCAARRPFEVLRNV